MNDIMIGYLSILGVYGIPIARFFLVYSPLDGLALAENWPLV